MRAVKDAGGVTFAQELETAKFDGMPRSAIAAGVVGAAARVGDSKALEGEQRHANAEDLAGAEVAVGELGGLEEIVEFEGWIGDGGDHGS